MQCIMARKIGNEISVACEALRYKLTAREYMQGALAPRGWQGIDQLRGHGRRQDTKKAPHEAGLMSAARQPEGEKVTAQEQD